MFTVSNFSIAEDIIKAACKAQNKAFVNLEVKLDNNGKVAFEQGVIYIGKPEKMTQACYNIVSVYLDNFETICGVSLFNNTGVDKTSVLTTISNYIRTLGYKSSALVEAKPIDPVTLRLYQFPLPWILMKDLICPAFDEAVKNVKVVALNSPLIDVGHFVEEKDGEESFIVLNLDVVYDPCRMAALFFNAIKAHDLDPNIVLGEVLDTELKSKLIGALKLAFKDDQEVEDFVTYLKCRIGAENTTEKMVHRFNKPLEKTAQRYAPTSSNFAGIGGSFWFLGLIEQMLEPTRGSDWTVYETLEPLHKELWDKIEKERKKAGREGLTYEALLRIQSGENKKENIKIIEQLLSSNRVW